MHHSAVRLTLPALILALAGTAAFAQNSPLEQPQPRQANPPEPPPAPPQAPVVVQDGPSYEVSSFQFRYATDHPDRPAIEDFLALPVSLSVVDGVFVAPREGSEQVTLTLQDLTSSARGTRRFSVSAINAIGGVIVKELNRRGLIGVLVSVDPSQIAPDTLVDQRSPDNRSLSLDIWTRTVVQVRTLGAGTRWARETAPRDTPSQESRVNSKYHDRIRDNSPMQPGTEGREGDLLRKDALDDYLFRLNRHPGRRVDAAIAAGDSPGDVVLDYIITENKPWTLYAQMSNTGTEQTNEWRQRIGFVHNQLMNRDDTLSLDFITAGFSETNAFIASYDAPVGSSETLRYKLYGSMSTFKASDVGFASERFEGDSYTAGAELALNVWQQKQSFIDIFGGLRFERQRVENKVVDVRGQTEFFIPYAGARFTRGTEKASISAEARIETNIGSVSTDEDQVNRLGRIFVDRDWTVFKWDVSSSFYLEPLLYGAEWSNPDAPYYKTTLAHEIALSMRGQHSFGNRLIPQQEFTAGGLYSVRGYHESDVAGDNGITFTAEYRYHVPRRFEVREAGSFLGKPFRWAPDMRYARPDWDLVLKGFTDIGRVTNADKQSFERDETLASLGIGIEFLYLRNLSLRADWAMALQDAGRTGSGDSRLHLVATLLY